MDALRQLQARVFRVWQGWDRRQRVAIVLSTVVTIVALMLLGKWASTREFATLANGLTPSEAHEAVSALQSEGIVYELNFSGSAISVPVNEISRARLALKQIGQEVAVDDSESAMEWWADPAQQRARQQRNLEKRLAKSITDMKSVRAATVHITSQDSSPFIRDQTPAKASIVLELESSAQFTAADSQAIISLVSHAVENLDPENTVIVDTDGHALSSPDVVGADVAGQLEFRRKMETDLARKAESLLIPMLGEGRAIVRVTADLDFTESTRAVTTYDSEGKAKQRETITTESSKGGGPGAGAAGNVYTVSQTSAPAATGTESDVENIDTTFLVPETTDTIREAPGKIKRLTVAAVVDLTGNQPAGETGGTAAGSPPAIAKADVEKIIREAVGLDESRNDSIEVMTASLPSVIDHDPPAGWGGLVGELTPLAGSISLGLASLVALFLGLRMVNRLKPVVVEVTRSETLDPEVQTRLASLTTEIMKHPDAVSTVLAGWLSGQTAGTSPAAGTPSVPAAAVRRAA
jgi:flagellar M-ring protein FliF